MIEFIYFIAIAIFIVVTFAWVAYHDSYEKLALKKKWINYLSIENVLSFIIIGSLLALSFSTFDKNLIFTKDFRHFVWVNALSTVLLCIFKFKLIPFFKKHWKVISYIFASISFIILLISGIYVDGEISRLTKEPVSEFPQAQKTILFIIAPMIISFLIYVILFYFYCHQLLIIIRGAIEFTKEESKILRKFFQSFRFLFGKKNRVINKDKINFTELSMFLGFSFLLIIYPKASQIAISSKAVKEKIPKLLVFSSYHNYAKDICEKTDYPTAPVSLLKRGRISFAIKGPDNTYSFYSGKCERVKSTDISSIPIVKDLKAS